MAGSFVNFSLLEALTSIWSTIGTFNHCYRQTFHSKINISNIFQIIKCLVPQKICILSSCSPVSHYLILTLLCPLHAQDLQGECTYLEVSPLHKMRRRRNRRLKRTDNALKIILNYLKLSLRQEYETPDVK